MIFSTVSLKGGVGKTTVAINTAVYLRHSGYRVLLIDSDANANAVSWFGVRGSEQLNIPTVAIRESKALLKNIRVFQKEYDLIVIDGTPSVDPLTSAILAITDVAIIPIKPSPLDVWATGKFMEAYNVATAVNQNIKTFVLPNEFDFRNVISRETVKVISEMPFTILESKLGNRVAFKECLASGLGVTEYTDPIAANEFANVILEINKSMETK
ncbi:MAG: AAA family ATPase [Bacteroidetes bacterium]|nr:AAA family ATPase [Bacteroidota bacterium]